MSRLFCKWPRQTQPGAVGQAVLVVNDKAELVGIVTRGDLMRVMAERHDHPGNVIEVAQTDLIVAHPEEQLHDVVAKMLKHDIGRLPVVDAANPRKIVGYIGRADILAARMRAHEEEEHREKGLALKHF